MLQWMEANLGTIVICLILIAVVALIIWSMIRRKKQGKSSCGCNCGHCAASSSCHSQK